MLGTTSNPRKRIAASSRGWWLILWLFRCWLIVVLAHCVAPADSVVGDEAYPSRTVTIVCPWSAGGGTDSVSRFWAAALEKKYDSPFVVVNRTGGAGAVGHFAAAHAEPDGHTIGMITFELCTMHRMNISKLTYRDYECLLQVNADPAAIVVREDAPWKTLNDWLDAVRGDPGTLKMSGTSTGGAWDLARAGLLTAAELPVDSVIWVPHPGSAPSLVELMGGHLDAVCCSVPEVSAHLAGQKVRVLAVMSAERMPSHPQLPTAIEQGIDWEAVGWRGLALPKGTPPEIIAELQKTCMEIADSSEYREFMAKPGFGIKIRKADEFETFLKDQDEQWNEVVLSAGYDKGVSATGDPGPLALPLLLIVGIALTVGWECVSAMRIQPKPDLDGPRKIEAPGAIPIVKTVVALLVYVGAIDVIGFALSTILFTTIATRSLGARWWSAVATAAILVLIAELLFRLTFQVQLPRGVVW